MSIAFEIDCNVSLNFHDNVIVAFYKRVNLITRETAMIIDLSSVLVPKYVDKFGLWQNSLNVAVRLHAESLHADQTRRLWCEGVPRQHVKRE